MKKVFLIFGLLLTVSLLAFNRGEKEMQLVHKPTQFVIVEMRDQEIIFHDPSLEDEMREIGIYIPQHMRAKYGDQEVIRISDPYFAAAFHDIYYKMVFDTTLYVWSDSVRA